MPVMPDWGGGGSTNYQRGQDAINALRPPAPPRAIARPAPPRPAPAPYQPRTPASYVAPVANYQMPYQAPSIPAQQQNIYSGPVGGGAVSGGGGMATAAVVQPKKTVDDFAKLYDTNAELAAVDSTFAEQRSLYGQLLKKYLADHDINIKNIQEDARLGKEGIEKNRVRGLTSLNEDFAARGLGRSGLQAKEHDDTTQAFKKQSTNVDTQLVRGETDLNSRKNKYIGENGENGSNMSAARREAYARLVAKQDIV